MLKKLAHSRQWLSFAQAVNQLSAVVKISRKRLWYEYGLKEMDVIRQYRRWRSQGRHPQANEFFPYLNPDFLERLNYRQRYREIEPVLPPPQSEREFQWRNLTSGVMVLPLEVVDCLSAAQGIETRHPFMDKRLVEYCLSLPASQKLNQGWSRAVMRRGMEGILPSEIQWRGSKGNSTAVFWHGLNKYDRPLLDEIAQQDFDRLGGYLNLDYARKEYDAAMNDNTKSIGALWLVFTLALWLRFKRRKS
jgi:asparagine synthase (glutamine-hydrolysing)